MLNNDLSESIKQEVDDIVRTISNNSTIANIEMTFTSPDFKDKNVYLCREIDTLMIDQDFVLNITDKITAELTMERDPYIGMLYMRKNMECELVITHTHPDKSINDEEYKIKPAWTKKYKVLVTKFEDLFKKMSTEQLFPTKRPEDDHDRKTYRMSVELIEEDIYKARKQSLYFTGRDTNMKDMMRYCINYFGFKKAYFCSPDNSRQYTNFVIPPSYGVEEIMSFLQNAPGLGIYNDGLISYISNGVWYVYPRYGEPVNKFTTHVYCLGGNKYAGLNRMDWDENEQTKKSWLTFPGTNEGKEVGRLDRGPKPIRIISPSEMDEKMFIAEGTENNVTGYIAQMSELVFDATRTLIDDDNCKMEHRTHDPLVVPPDVMDFENHVRIKHIKSKGNLFRIASDLRSMMTRSLSFRWDNARPFTILPATAVFVHYDDHATVQQTIGIAEHAVYTYQRDKQTSILFPRWVCTGNVTVNVSVRGEGLIQSQR